MTNPKTKKVMNVVENWQKTKTSPAGDGGRWEKRIRKEIEGSILPVLMNEEMDNLVGLIAQELKREYKRGIEDNEVDFVKRLSKAVKEEREKMAQELKREREEFVKEMSVFLLENTFPNLIEFLKDNYLKENK